MDREVQEAAWDRVQEAADLLGFLTYFGWLPREEQTAAQILEFLLVRGWAEVGCYRWRARAWRNFLLP